jgi:hypothetical protein
MADHRGSLRKQVSERHPALKRDLSAKSVFEDEAVR